MKVGDRFVLRHLGDEVQLTKVLGGGKVEVAFLPRLRSRLIVTADKSLIPVPS